MPTERSPTLFAGQRQMLIKDSLILESLSVTPRPTVSDSDKSSLQFRVIYLCWEKSKAPTAPQ